MSEVKLKDITISITDGKHGDCRGENDSGYYFVSCKDVYDGLIHYDNARQIMEDDFLDADKRTKLSANDILVTNSGTIGRMALVKDVPETRRTTFQKSVAIVKPNTDKVLPIYLYYLLQSKVYDFVNSSNGAAQKNLLLSTMREFDLEIEDDVNIQHCIATILSRYDSLIENYQKQIKLLEEAAQRLYKEWFVDLHFPGHETTKIVDGVPEGWEKKKLVEIAELKAGGDKPEIVSGIRTNDCSVPIFSNGTTNEGLYGYTNLPVIVEQSVTISARGSVGFTVLRRTPFVPIVRLISVTPHNVYVGYIFYYLKSTTLDSNGAAQQQITIPMIRNKEITIPSKCILELFESKTEPIFNQIDIFKEQIRLLTEARDRLLPKLMSGEIAV